ncbi:MAG: hypothetical protein IJB96_01550 [Lachnospira sp.]|nr:hypothetical protein [Lachnospira sp.]
MGKIRLCTNAECVACQKKTVYKKGDDTFCVKCGGELVYMCKNCKEVELTESDGDYCPECQVLQDEKREKMFATMKKVGAGVAASGTVIAATVKIVSDIRKGHKKAKKVLDKIDPDRAKLEKVKAKAKKMVKKAQKKYDK